MVSIDTRLAQLVADPSTKQEIEQLKQEIIEQKKAGFLVILDGSEQSMALAYLAKVATTQLSESTSLSYSCFSYLLDDELYAGYEKQALIKQLELLQCVELHIDDALDELVLEAEYSYKKLGMSRHMSLQAKRQLRSQLARQTAAAIALDMNLKLLSAVV